MQIVRCNKKPPLLIWSPDYSGGFQMRKLASLLCLLPTLAFSYDYQLSFDDHIGMKSGVDMTLSGFTAYRHASDMLLKDTDGMSGNLMEGARFAKWAILDQPLTIFTMVANHEFSGHGARFREFGIPVKEYMVSTQGGYTAFDVDTFIDEHRLKQVMTLSGGMEANSILADKLRERMLLDGKFDYRDGSLFVWTSTDAYEYIGLTEEWMAWYGYGDPALYLAFVNDWHDPYDPNDPYKYSYYDYPEDKVTLGQLKTAALIGSLTDPMLHYALYGNFRYIITGRTMSDSPMIPLNEDGSVAAIGHYRPILAPWGLEHSFVANLRTPGKLFTGTMRNGKNGTIGSKGMSIRSVNWYVFDRISLDTDVYYWYQPNLRAKNAADVTMRHGVGVVNTFNYQHNKVVSGHLDVGAKTEGFVPGEPAAASAIVRAGIKLHY